MVLSLSWLVNDKPDFIISEREIGRNVYFRIIPQRSDRNILAVYFSNTYFNIVIVASFHFIY